MRKEVADSRDQLAKDKAAKKLAILIKQGNARTAQRELDETSIAAKYLGGKRRVKQRNSIFEMAPGTAVTKPLKESSGWLQKKGKFGVWQKRWFQTQSHYLVYQKKKGSKVLGGIDLASPDTTITSFVSKRDSVGLNFESFALRVKGWNSDAVHHTEADKKRAMRTFELRFNFSAAPDEDSELYDIQDWVSVYVFFPLYLMTEYFSQNVMLLCDAIM
jgi:hypothetical protein